MAGFAVKRYLGNEGGNASKHHISLVCPSKRTVYAKIDLPFGENDCVIAGSCRGLVYLHSRRGKIVIINLSTLEMVVPPTPKFKPPPHSGLLIATGLGYIAESQDYKLVRIYNQYYEDKFGMYAGCKSHCQVYSIKHGSWKKIKAPGAHLTSHTGVYINNTRSCYWIAALGHTFGAIAAIPCLDHVMPFNFAAERFGNPFSLPEFAVDEDADAQYELVECCDSLGVIVYKDRDGPFSIKLFQLVDQEMCWKELYYVALDHVSIQRPVGLDDSRFLFLEARHGREISQLLVYDLVRDELKDLGIYDSSGVMSTISYVASQYELPKPEQISMVRYVETTVPPLDSEPISSFSRTKIKRGSKSKRMKTKATFIGESSQQQ